MSDPDSTGYRSLAPVANGEQRSGCMTAFLFLAGVILLLPGLCAAFFSFVALSEKSWPGELTGLILFGLAVGTGGVALIVKAFRR
ncbi:hypothetical protein ACQR1W_10020 [Bradyrhizobium sp. HKCCYLS1011]|uniref:hypothetical protein n=1 Tax=Bradyrhizobium sp. HKCCYLS1011 TaxID=3420733 RepID=UPI003EBB7478